MLLFAQRPVGRLLDGLDGALIGNVAPLSVGISFSVSSIYGIGLHPSPVSRGDRQASVTV